MAWTVLYYKSARGGQIVLNFIELHSRKVQAKIMRYVDLIEECGPFLGMPYAKQLSSQIFELRIRGKEEIRIFYTFKGHHALLLHAFKKQTNKMPKREYVTALKRLESLT